MKKKDDLDREVALLLNKRRKEVADVTAMFIDLIMKSVAMEGEVFLNKLGRLKLVTTSGLKQDIKLKPNGHPGGVTVQLQTKHQVYVTKTHRFRALIKQYYKAPEEKHGKARR